jgi:threonine dehydrogenase-like Zn-dependent dehydrogenase
MVAHPSQLLPIPEDLSDEAAVMVEPLACAVHAARKAAASGPHQRIAVLGSGTLGLLTIAALRSEGAGGTILATAKHPHQHVLARGLGAERVVSPRTLPRVVRSLTGAFVLDSGQLTDGIELVVDCVGSEASLAQALQVVAPGGQVLVVGMPGHTSLDLTGLWHRESSITGCYAYTRPDFERALELAQEHDLGRLVSATYPLSRYTEAIEHAANAGSRGAVKVVFDLRKPTRSKR